jgi:hypothetical protein
MKYFLIIISIAIISCSKKWRYVYVGEEKIPITETYNFIHHIHVYNNDSVAVCDYNSFQIIENDTITIDIFKKVKE